MIIYFQTLTVSAKADQRGRFSSGQPKLADEVAAVIQEELPVFKVKS